MADLPTTHALPPGSSAPTPPGMHTVLPLTTSTEADNRVPEDQATARSPCGRYELVQVHAQGGLGQVSVARDVTLGRTVALKEIRSDRLADQVQRARFINEAAITGQLEHPGIVPIYTLDRDAQGKPYYAMRFIQGRTLTLAIEQHHAQPTPLGLRKLLQHFISVCQTMAYAHNKGVIHRDLKPDNVMLGDYGETLVVDWGLAKQLKNDECGMKRAEAPAKEESGIQDSIGIQQSSLTQDGQIMGTPAFMAPEQARGEVHALSPATDVYALGSILYVILTGRSPYQGSLLEVLSKIQQGPPPPSPLEVARSTPKALAAVCGKAMAAGAAERYPSAEALARDMENWLGDEPTSVYAEPFAVRLRRWARRHRLLVAGSAVGLIVLAVMLGVLAVLSHSFGRRESQLRQLAERHRDTAQLTIEQMTSPQALAFLRRQPELRPEQREFLRMALTYYQELAAGAATTPEERARQALALNRLCLLHLDIGQHMDAEQAARQAIAAYDALIADFPGHTEYAQEQAVAHHNLGAILQGMGQYVEAERELQLSLRQMDALRTRAPGNAAYPRSAGNTHNYLGNLYYQLGRYTEAEVEYRAALAISRTLAQTTSPDLADRRGLGASLNNVGLLLKKVGRREEAEKYLCDSLGIYQEIEKTAPHDPAVLRSVAIAQLNLGGLHTLAGRRSQATQSYHAAVNIYSRLVAEFPTVPHYRFGLANSHSHLGSLLNQLGRRPEAEEHVRQAMERYAQLPTDYPGTPEYRGALANGYEDLGRVLESFRRLHEADKLYRQSLELYSALAREFPAVPGYRASVAMLLQARGWVLKDLGQKPETEAALKQALALRRELAEEYYAIPDYRENVAMSLSALGFFLAFENRHDEALAALNEAYNIVTALAQADPKKPLYLRRVGTVLVNRSRVYARSGRLREAAQDLARASEFHAKALLLDPQGTATFFDDQWHNFLEDPESKGMRKPRPK